MIVSRLMKKSKLSKKEDHLNDVIPICRTIMTFRKQHSGVQCPIVLVPEKSSLWNTGVISNWKH